MVCSPFVVSYAILPPKNAGGIVHPPFLPALVVVPAVHHLPATALAVIAILQELVEKEKPIQFCNKFCYEHFEMKICGKHCWLGEGWRSIGHSKIVIKYY